VTHEGPSARRSREQPWLTHPVSGERPLAA
jgi:hypothetical protein